MHPYDAYDAQRNIEWVVHLVGKVLLSAWTFGMVATILGGVAGYEPVEILGICAVVWPLLVSIWLMYSTPPEPMFLDEDDADS